jgi:hypothetical protein
MHAKKPFGRYLASWKTGLLLIVFIAVSELYIANAQDDDPCVHCPSYVQSTAAVKEEIIWQKVVKSEYDEGALPPFKTLCESVALLNKVDFNNIFDRFSDERPANFQRFFHFHGIVAKVRFVPTPGSSFTGIFKGAEHGILRFSPLAPLMREKYLINHFIGTFLFSFGVKFYRDGIHSGNINTGDSVKGLRAYTGGRKFYDLPDFNIFSRNLDNMSGIDDRFDVFFGEYEKFSGVISTADAASYDAVGTEEANPKAPIIASFRPNPVLKDRFGRGDVLDFRQWVTSDDVVTDGTLLYTVWTTMNKSTGEASLCLDPNGGVPQVDDDVARLCPEQQVIQIGSVIAKSRFIAAEWSDKSLLFQHHRMCPKDQSTCAFDADPSTPRPDFTIPDTLFAGNTETFCVSSDDKTGLVTGNAPDCPAGSVPRNNLCFPGTHRAVEGLQERQCPFMAGVGQDILSVAEGNANTALPACDFWYNLQNNILTVMLTVTSVALRTTIKLVPFLQFPIDWLVGLIPRP